MPFAGRGKHAGDVEPACLRHEAEIEPGDARSRRVQHVEGVPAGLLALGRGARDAGGKPEDGGAIGARGSAGADDHHRALGAAFKVSAKVCLPSATSVERLRAGAEILVRVGEMRRARRSRRP